MTLLRIAFMLWLRNTLTGVRGYNNSCMLFEINGITTREMHSISSNVIRGCCWCTHCLAFINVEAIVWGDILDGWKGRCWVRIKLCYIRIARLFSKRVNTMLSNAAEYFFLVFARIFWWSALPSTHLYRKGILPNPGDRSHDPWRLGIKWRLWLKMHMYAFYRRGFGISNFYPY